MSKAVDCLHARHIQKHEQNIVACAATWTPRAMPLATASPNRKQQWRALSDAHRVPLALNTEGRQNLQTLGFWIDAPSGIENVPNWAEGSSGGVGWTLTLRISTPCPHISLRKPIPFHKDILPISPWYPCGYLRFHLSKPLDRLDDLGGAQCIAEVHPGIIGTGLGGGNRGLTSLLYGGDWARFGRHLSPFR